MTQRVQDQARSREEQRPDQDQAEQGSLLVPVLAVAIAAFCFAFQETSVLPALSAIQGHLPGATTSTVTFLESGYLVIAAISAPTLGKIGDRRGKKPIILVAMLTYFAGALGAALTPNFAGLVVFRAVQGVGGAIFALSLAIMRPLAGERLPLAISGIIGGFGLGITAGFASSGVITSLLGWRWIFGIEGMLILVGAALIFFFLPDPSERSDTGRDLPGAALLGFGVGSLLLALTFGPNMGWTSPQVLALFAVSPVLLAGWWVRENRTEEPLLDVAVLKSRDILFPNVAAALAGYGAFSTYLLVPRLAQTPAQGPTSSYGLGLDLTAVGLLMMTIGIGTLTGATTAGMLASRIGGKWPFVGAMCVLALGPSLLAFYRPNLAVIGVWLFVTGMGFGASTGSAGTFVTQSAPEGSTGVATSFNTLSRLVGGGIGSQVGTIILIVTRYHGSAVSHFYGYQLAFGAAAGLALVGAVLASFVTQGQES